MKVPMSSTRTPESGLAIRLPYLSLSPSRSHRADATHCRRRKKEGFRTKTQRHEGVASAAEPLRPRAFAACGDLASGGRLRRETRIFVSLCLCVKLILDNLAPRSPMRREEPGDTYAHRQAGRA